MNDIILQLIETLDSSIDAIIEISENSIDNPEEGLEADELARTLIAMRTQVSGFYG